MDHGCRETRERWQRRDGGEVPGEPDSGARGQQGQHHGLQHGGQPRHDGEPRDGVQPVLSTVLGSPLVTGEGGRVGLVICDMGSRVHHMGTHTGTNSRAIARAGTIAVTEDWQRGDWATGIVVECCRRKV